METAEIRRRWLRYFSTRGHTVVPSAPLVPADPDRLFVESGMTPFTPFLFGQQPAPFARVASVQKCLRPSDSGNAGRTSGHSTFFQMNGNFSFGDYGAKDAIELAWELITRHQSDGGYGLDEKRLWVTVLHGDEETIQAWQQIAVLPGDRIIRRGPNQNYWHAELPGPGGPRTGIYIDRGADYGPDGGPEADEDRYLQFWSLVFLRDQVAGVRGMGNVDIAGALPARTIVSGMGLERMACLLQGVDNVNEIDEVFPVIARVEELSGRRYGTQPEDDLRMRVVADHVRGAMMLIGDGVTPADRSADERGYVVRRLLRQAAGALRLLGVREPGLADLMSVSMQRMEPVYPELRGAFSRIAQVAAQEESRPWPQPVAEPIDLTPDTPADQELSIDDDELRSLLSEAAGSEEARVLNELRQPGTTEFTGFHELTTESAIRGLLAGGMRIPAAEKGQIVQVVLERTPFYAESGGQVADQGEITADGARLRVVDVQRPVQGLIVHAAEVIEGTIQSGQDVLASVDREWRLSACQAHSATHVLHAALRQVLGPQALQSGSYNRPGYLRLDFAWDSALDQGTRDEVESVANLALRYDYPVTATYMPLAQARELGALALFADTYDEQVRVVEMGGAWSRELCGGTHVEHSSQIGAITITGESSVAAGIRRLEALSGLDALRFLSRQRALVGRLVDVLKVPADDLPGRVGGILERLRDAERELERQRRAALLAGAADLAQASADVFGVSVVTHDAGTGAADDARALVLDVRDRLPADRPGVVAVSVLVKERPMVVVATNGEARHWGVKAGELIREAATVLGGGGGGRDDLAQGGGTEAGKVEEALRRIEHSVGERVTSRG